MKRPAVRIDPCGRPAAVVIGLLCAGAVLAGCARTEEYQLGQRIDMGPYSFDVAGTDEGTWASEPTISILFRLDRDDTAPFTTDFWQSFAYKMEIVDAAGNAFPVDPHPQSAVYTAGRYRSDRYLAEVKLSPSHEGVRDSARIGRTAADFRLIIDNPAPEGSQPRRVAIQLR
jgi:hypothetical protein